MRFAFLVLAALCFLVPTARADQNSGLAYTTLHAQETKTQGSLRLKTFGGEDKPDAAEAESAAAAAVWEKYKALAAGTYKEEEKAAPSVKKPEAPEKPTPAAAQESAPPKQKGALSSLIDDYYKNRSEQGKMRRLVISTPETAPAE